MLDACEHKNVVGWCRMQASSHNWQGVVDARVNETGMSTVTPNRSAVFCCWNGPGKEWLFAALLLQHPIARASKPPQECDASCQHFAKWLEVSTIRERHVQHYSEYLGSEENGKVSLLWLTFSSRLFSLLLRWKTADTVVVLSFTNLWWHHLNSPDHTPHYGVGIWNIPGQSVISPPAPYSQSAQTPCVSYMLNLSSPTAIEPDPSFLGGTFQHVWY